MPALNIRGLLLIALAVALTFANALHDGFHFDDDHSLVANPHILRTRPQEQPIEPLSPLARRSAL